MQDEPERVAGVWLRTTRLLAAVVMPMMFGLAVIAPDLVPALLGARWESATPVVQILAGVAVLQALSALGAKVLTALGRTKTLFHFSIASNLVLIPAFALGLHWGIVGVAVAYALVNIPTTWALIGMTTRALRVSAGRFVRALAGVTIASLEMLAAIMLANIWLVEAGVNSYLRLGITAVIGLVSYVPLCLWLVPEVLSELKAVVAKRNPQPTHVAAR
jgi:O-antigen/teichoic acid export membrane protein